MTVAIISVLIYQQLVRNRRYPAFWKVSNAQLMAMHLSYHSMQLLIDTVIIHILRMLRDEDDDFSRVHNWLLSVEAKLYPNSLT